MVTMTRFENKHAQAHTRKMGNSVLKSYLHRQGHREKWIAQIFDTQSD